VNFRNQTIRGILSELEDYFPELTWTQEDSNYIVTFILPENRKHTITISENRLGKSPRTWSISAKIGKAEDLKKVINTFDEFNSANPFGVLILDGEQVRLYNSLLYSITTDKHLLYTAYLLSQQADDLEKLISDKDNH
jgi:hypothetical protein